METVARRQRPLLSLFSILTGLIGLTMISSARQASQADAAPPCPGDYTPGIVLVGFRADVSSAERDIVLNRWTVAVDVPAIGAAAVRAPVGQECAALETLKQDPRVAFAELDYAAHATEIFFFVQRRGAETPRPQRDEGSSVPTLCDPLRLCGSALRPSALEFWPDDPAWPQQWGPAKINAPEAWAITTGASDVVVAIVDSGVRLNHEDLAANLWSNPGEIPGNRLDDDGNGQVDDFWGWHFYHGLVWNGEEYVYRPLENNAVTDENGHGTHVAGIAGARVNNGAGIAGMASGARLMIIKVLDEYGDGWYSDIAQGIVYAVDNGARVINLSLGGRAPSQTLQEAVNYAHAHGALIVAAAGNRDPKDGYDAVLYPAACEHVLAVAATDQDDVRPSFSNHGPSVAVAAPGVDIYSAWYLGNYATKSGTSMAAPHVSGLAALIWSARPDRTATQVSQIITNTTADVNSGTLLLPGWDEYLGWGRIKAGLALAETARAGDLALAVSRAQLLVGETAIVTATTPLTAGDRITFTVSGGTPYPEAAALTNGVATATLIAGPVTGMAIVTGTTGTLAGSLYIRLLPGTVVSAVLTPAQWTIPPGSAVAVTLTAADRFGNPPLDGIAVYWSADGGEIAPSRSLYDDGASWAEFIAGDTRGSAVITASLETGETTTVTIVVAPVSQLYLPLIVRNGENLTSQK